MPFRSLIPPGLQAVGDEVAADASGHTAQGQVSRVGKGLTRLPGDDDVFGEGPEGQAGKGGVGGDGGVALAAIEPGL